ncbi:MAG: hypothetical protein WKF85_12085 [Chitinophagaceae bacterium]
MAIKCIYKICKNIDVVTKLVTEHIVKGNSVKLLSAPVVKEDVLEKEEKKETFYLRSKVDYKKLDETTKQLLLSDFTTPPPFENYDQE